MSPVPSDAASTTVVVVGAGPAGMAAAVQLAEAAVPVTVLDTYPAAGGQYHRVPAPGLDRGRDASASGSSGSSVPPSSDPVVAAFTHHLAARAIDLRSATTIWTATVEDGPAPFVLQLAGPGGDEVVGAPSLRAASVVLATGATDRVLPFPGSDLPGVLTVGGAQALLKGQGVRAGERMVVAGSGPFLLPVAAALAGVGTEVAAVAEAQPLATIARHAPVGWQYRATLTEGAGYAGRLLRHRVPLSDRTAVTAARGDGRVEEVTLSRLGPDWAPVVGQERHVAVDAAAVSFGFVPQVGLAALLGCAITPDPVWGDPAVTVDAHQASSVPGVFAAGELTGVSGAAGAAAEGALAGLAAAHALGVIDTAALKERGRLHRRERARRQAFAAALGRMYARQDGWVGWLTDDTIVCRCEEVDHATIRRAIVDLQAADLRSVKLTTRCGMGMCQARMCGDAVATLVAHHRDEPPTDLGALSTPTVLAPVPLRRLAQLATSQHAHPTTDAQHAAAASGDAPHAAAAQGQDHPDPTRPLMRRSEPMAPPTETTVTRSVDPRTGTAFGPEYRDATPAEVASAVEAAADAFPVTRRAAPVTIAGLLDAIAEGLEALGEELIDTAVAETGLDVTRITGERGRTCGQLRAFAEVARAGSHLDIRIDPADPDTVPPRPDLRRMQVPLGPVAVWGASNFPLAFSVPGGDTASALAAGCPVVAKAHPSHPATSQLCAAVIAAAVAEVGLPAGTFALLHGRDPSVSRALVTAPGIAAAGFTGSQPAGRALYDLAAARPDPIPVFAEMGSLNPQFVTEAAIAEREQELAAGLVGSVTLGTGQFCTKPGLVFLPDTPAGRELETAITAAAAEVAPAPLLGDGIGSGLRARLGELAELTGVAVALADQATDVGAWAGPTVLVTDADTLARTPVLREECFGPATILVRVGSPEEMVALVPGLPGSLTASIHAAGADLDHLEELVGALQHRVGRVVWNQFPTGVAVTHAMHHAGPYPASTFVQHTSVGSAAIARFVRPVTFQNTPQELLPEPLRDDNPHGRWRLVDGQLTREAIT